MKRGYWELDVQIYRSIIRLMETVALFVEMFKSVNPAQLLLTSGVFHDLIEPLLHAGLPTSSIVIIYSRAQLSRSSLILTLGRLLKLITKMISRFLSSITLTRSYRNFFDILEANWTFSKVNAILIEKL